MPWTLHDAYLEQQAENRRLLDELEKLGALCHAAEKDRDLALVRAEQAEAEADGLILDRAELRKHVEHLTAERDEARAEVSRLRTIVATVTAQVKAWRSLPGDALKPYDMLLGLEALLAGKGPRKKVKP